jgi:hypothetical protein
MNEDDKDISFSPFSEFGEKLSDLGIVLSISDGLV